MNWLSFLKRKREGLQFVTDDSRFIEMIKEKGLLEKEGKRIR